MRKYLQNKYHSEILIVLASTQNWQKCVLNVFLRQ